jgi:toxin FitB
VSGVVVDTCVVSDPPKPRPDPNVRRWFERQAPADLFIASVVAAEIAAGVWRTPDGARRLRHESWLRRLVTVDFVGRILPFDEEAALLYGRIVAQSYAQGRPPDMADAQIAAIALSRGMAVATRDLRGFEAFGVELVDPWAG